jgi:glycosyltransferase involved in cell wall biosynthesis
VKLWVVLPAYNEAAAIGSVIRQIRTITLSGIEKEILVVDDGSRDGTADIARAEGAHVVRHMVNRGLGGALGTGLEAARRRGADILITCDADGQHAPEDIIQVVDPILKGKADAVIGSRMVNSRGMPMTRRLANRMANLITYVLYGIKTTDSQSGLRAFSRTALERIRITTNTYEVSSEICGEIGRHGLRFAEVPIRAIYTDYSLSKGQGVGVGLKTLLRLFLFRWVR